MKQKYFYYPASFLFCHYEFLSPVKKILFPKGKNEFEKDKAEKINLNLVILG